MSKYIIDTEKGKCVLYENYSSYAEGYQQGRADERERIISELEENKRKIQSMRNTCIALSDREVMGIENAVYKRAIEIVRGGGDND